MIDTQSLKNKILDLAIRGKLTRQLPDDGTAEELYEKIQKEKQALVEAGKLKKEKPLKEIEKDEVPFEIPESWKWVRFGKIISLQSGQDLTKSEYNDDGKGIPYITGASNYGESNTIYINRWTEYPKSFAQSGDILLSCKGTVGKLAILYETEIHIARQIMGIRTYAVNIPFVLYYLQSMINGIKEAQKGLIPGIERNDVLSLMCPLPPVVEQKRIVEKVEILFAEIDTIEKLQNQYAADAEILKSKLIDAAIQGKLTEQLPSDGTAEELYQQIQTEKQALISAGKIKKEKPLKEIEEDEIPFEIPESWKWVRLEQVTYSVGNKTNQIKTNDVKPDGEIPVVSQGQKMIDGYCDEKEKIITDIPLVMFGDHTRIVKYIDFPFVIGADGTKFHHCISVNPKYFYYWMLHATAVLRDKGYARHYSLLKKQLIPLPPMAEQKRIVEVIERLFKVFA